MELVTQSQIVQSVTMQDCQYILSHLLPVCNLLVHGTNITYSYCLLRRFYISQCCVTLNFKSF